MSYQDHEPLKIEPDTWRDILVELVLMMVRLLLIGIGLVLAIWLICEKEIITTNRPGKEVR